MIEGKNILCFGSENWEYPGFQQTVMRKLSSRNRVIYVNSIGTRKFTLKVAQFQFYVKRLKRIINPPNNNPTSTTGVYSPRMIPIVYNNLISRLNKQLIRYQFKRILAHHNFESYILWIGTPTAAFLLDSFRPELMVYHAVDRYSEFPFVNRRKIRMFEGAVARRADVILCTSDAIKDDLLVHNKRVFTISHAVEYNHFNSASQSTFVPEDLKNIPKPIIGYFGGLSERVNFELIKKISVRYPYASIVLLGNKLKKIDEIENLSNVYLLGYKDYNSLPYYLKEFNVCLIPYLVNELMKGVDPIKLREYLCLGKPIVSVDLPEVRKFKKLVYVCEDDDSYMSKVGEALNEDNKDIIEERRNFARIQDWSVKIEHISDIIMPFMSDQKGPECH